MPPPSSHAPSIPWPGLSSPTHADPESPCRRPRAGCPRREWAPKATLAPLASSSATSASCRRAPSTWPRRRLRTSVAARDEGKSVVFVGVNGTLAGGLALADRPRDTAREAVGLLREQGVRWVVMLTGDDERTAAQVAAELGLRRTLSPATSRAEARAPTRASRPVWSGAHGGRRRQRCAGTRRGGRRRRDGCRRVRRGARDR